MFKAVIIHAFFSLSCVGLVRFRGEDEMIYCTRVLSISCMYVCVHTAPSRLFSLSLARCVAANETNRAGAEVRYPYLLYSFLLYFRSVTRKKKRDSQSPAEQDGIRNACTLSPELWGVGISIQNPDSTPPPAVLPACPNNHQAISKKKTKHHTKKKTQTRSPPYQQPKLEPDVTHRG